MKIFTSASEKNRLNFKLQTLKVIQGHLMSEIAEIRSNFDISIKYTFIYKSYDEITHMTTIAQNLSNLSDFFVVMLLDNNKLL